MIRRALQNSTHTTFIILRCYFFMSLEWRKERGHYCHDYHYPFYIAMFCGQSDWQWKVYEKENYSLGRKSFIVAVTKYISTYSAPKTLYRPQLCFETLPLFNVRLMNLSACEAKHWRKTLPGRNFALFMLSTLTTSNPQGEKEVIPHCYVWDDRFHEQGPWVIAFHKRIHSSDWHCWYLWNGKKRNCPDIVDFSVSISLSLRLPLPSLYFTPSLFIFIFLSLPLLHSLSRSYSYSFTLSPFTPPVLFLRSSISIFLILLFLFGRFICLTVTSSLAILKNRSTIFIWYVLD